MPFLTLFLLCLIFFFSLFSTLHPHSDIKWHQVKNMIHCLQPNAFMKISNLAKSFNCNIFINWQERVQVVNGALTISRMVLSDAGIYQCVAENKYGEVYSNAELRVIGKYLFKCVLLDARWYICFYIVEWKTYVCVRVYVSVC